MHRRNLVGVPIFFFYLKICFLRSSVEVTNCHVRYIPPPLPHDSLPAVMLAKLRSQITLRSRTSTMLPPNRFHINSRVILYQANWSVLLTLRFKIKHAASKIIYIVKDCFMNLTGKKRVYYTKTALDGTQCDRPRASVRPPAQTHTTPPGHVIFRVIKTTHKVNHNPSRLKKDFQYCFNTLNRLRYEY